MHFRITPLDLTAAWRGQPLIADFLGTAGRATEFFAYPPQLETALEAALTARAASFQGPRAAVAAALRQANRRYGAGEATERHLEALAQEGTFAVVTGQQPGLLTGPLYTLYKALTAVLLCEQLSARRRERFVPVFWMATEDDDLEEVRRTWFVDSQNELRAVELPLPDSWGGTSVGALPLDFSWEDLVAPLREHLPPTEFQAEVLTFLRETFAAASNLGDWFAQLLTHLLKETGLVLFDPLEPSLRALMVPVLEQALADPLGATEATNVAGDRLVAAGYPRQTHRLRDQCPFYVYREGRRERVFFREGRFCLGPDSYTRQELQAWLATAPERFSTSLVLRPIVQDFLLPTAIFIGGPGELSYLAQLRGVYAWAHLAPPLFLPRLSATLVEPKVARTLHRYGLTVPDFWEDLGKLTARVARETVGHETAALFATAREQLAALLAPLQAHVAALDPSLERTAEQTGGRIQHELSRLEEKALRAVKRQNDILVAQIRSAHTHLFPQQRLQERLLNIIPYLIKFGPDLMTPLVQGLRTAEIGQHVLLEMESEAAGV
jgi:bacillithiol biosynthesis cysteine-adding enzyme BshC